MASHTIKYNKPAPSRNERPAQTKTLLASAISAVLIGTYGMPVRAEDDGTLSPAKLSITRGDYDIGDNDMFSGNSADATKISLNVAVGERWHARVNYQEIDGQREDNGINTFTQTSSFVSGPYNVFVGYNTVVINESQLEMDTVDFEAGYDIALGETASLQGYGGLRYIEMNADSNLGGKIDGTIYASSPSYGVPRFEVEIYRTPLVVFPGIITQQELDGYGFRAGMDGLWQFSEDWSLSGGVAADYLYADREAETFVNGVLTASEDDSSWYTGMEGDIAINYAVTTVSEDSTGFIISLGYHYATWYDMMIDGIDSEADVELKGAYLRLDVEF